MAVVFSATIELPSAHGAIKGLIDPVANFRAAVHRDWLESASAGAEIALENLAGYAQGSLIYGAGSDWAPLTIGTNGYILGSDGTDVLWSSIHLDEHAPTGFPNRTDTSISFADGSRTLTLAKTGASFDVYIKGVKYTYTENQTKQITDTEGTWWFYIDSAGALDAAQTAPNLRDTAWVAIVYWNATGNVALDIAEERHGMTMDGATHALLHFTVGTRWESGLAAGDYTLAGDGDSDADAQLSIGDGIVDDEDLPIIITDDSPQNLAPIAYIPVYYLDGANPNWRKTIADAFPVYDNVGDEISYNLDTGGTWSHPAADNNNYVAMWIFGSSNVAEPVIAILGQRQDTSLGDARENNTYESLVFDTLPFQELKLIYRLIFNTREPQHANTPHCRLVDIQDLRSVSNLPSGTYVATAHSSLTGRDARYSHPASAVSVDLTNMDHLLSGLVAPTTDDVQAALEVLDDILENAQTVNAAWTWSTSNKILFRDAALSVSSQSDGHLTIDADVSIDFTGDILVTDTYKAMFRDSAIYVYSANDTFLDLVADGAIRLNADTLSPLSAKHYFDAGAAAGGEWIESPADTIGRLVAGAYWQVGTSTPTHITGTANSFHVSGKSEFDNNAFFEGIIFSYSDGASALFFSDASGIVYASFGGDESTDQFIVGLTGEVDHQFIITDYTNRTRDLGHADAVNPALIVTSATSWAVQTDEWCSITHDVTDAVYNLGSGVHKFIGGPITIYNAVDQQSNLLQTLEGDRATMGDNDEIYQSFKLSNDAGEQTEFGRTSAIATDVTDTEEDGAFSIDVMVAGALTEVFRADATFATNWTDLTDAGETALHSHAAAAPAAHEIASAGGFHTAAGLTVGHVLRASAADAFAFAAIAAGDLPTAIDAAKIGDGSVSNAEFELLDDYNTIGLAALTSAEVDQLENIAATTISEAQWAYLGALDQALTQASSPTFAALTINGNIAVTGTVDGVDVAGLKSDFDTHDGTVEKTADQVISNDATLEDDTELLFAMAANETYTFEFVLHIHNDGGPAAGVKVALNGPAAAGNVFYWVEITTAFAFGPLTVNGGRAIAYEAEFAEAIAGGEWICCRISGSVENGANAGDLILRWAQNAAVVVDVRMKQGSYVTWHKV